ncbi:MAG: VWA domain-containing protein [Halobacterium sp.]
MSQKRKLELSRRRVLGALGTIGVASAGAGLGTSAYFSDQETFQNNRLVAGSLDLKVDWEEHYSTWSDDENDDRTDDEGGDEPATDFEVLMEAPPADQRDAYTSFPPGASNPSIWVPDEYVDDFMRNTALEAFPDSNNDGTGEFPAEELLPSTTPCELLADVGGDDAGLVPDEEGLGRTDNDDTRLDDGTPAPLINLQDVKPGDFGEITFSTHLCDNPGYLWMNAKNVTMSENDVVEPEADDDDEDQVEGSGDPALKSGKSGEKTVELAEEVQTAIWYDNNCDNLITGEEKLDIIALADTSGSIDGSLSNADANEEIDLIAEAANRFVDNLPTDTVNGSPRVRAGFLTFNGEGDAGTAADQPQLRANLGSPSQFDTDGDGSSNVEDFLPDSGDGNTPMPHALDLGRKILDDQGRPDARQVILLVTDGLPDYTNGVSYTVSLGGHSYTSATYSSSGTGSTAGERDTTAQVADDIKGEGIDILTAGIGLQNLNTTVDGDQFLQCRVAGLVAESPEDPNVCAPDQHFPTTFANLSQTAQDIAQQLVGGQGTGDQLIFTGSLADALDELQTNEGRGIPLDGDRSTMFEEGVDSENDGDRDCFHPSSTHCFGLAWWLPLDHGNEVQSDSVSFDVGFYTEQCRHNDGAGMNNDTVDA